MDHDFEPFLEWVNTELVRMQFLAIDGEAENATWSKLVAQPDDAFRIHLPVWLNQDASATVSNP